mmetsp:Transcript_4050/g.5104  ORF Transcript_4050/g.5104 Transcript_4050/m.5104 type:complete len:320 (+) Transcript_4050:18-977(+)
MCIEYKHLNVILPLQDIRRMAPEKLFYSFETSLAFSHPDYSNKFEKPAEQVLRSLAVIEASHSDQNKENKLHIIRESKRERHHWLIELPWLSLTIDHWLQVLKKLDGLSIDQATATTPRTDQHAALHGARCIIVHHPTYTAAVEALLGLQMENFLSAAELLRITQVWKSRATHSCTSHATKTYHVLSYLNQQHNVKNENEATPNLNGIDNLLSKLLRKNLIALSSLKQHAKLYQPQSLHLITGALSRQLPNDFSSDVHVFDVEYFISQVKARKVLEWPDLKRNIGEAYATILTANDDYYLMGAIVLGWSISVADSTRDR